MAVAQNVALVFRPIASEFEQIAPFRRWGYLPPVSEPLVQTSVIQLLRLLNVSGGARKGGHGGLALNGCMIVHN